MGVYADYNVMFQRSAAEASTTFCHFDAPLDPVLADEGRELAFPSRPSLACAGTRDGKIMVLVVAQAGRWGPGFGREEAGTAWINHHAWLETDVRHFHEDRARFQRMIAHTTIRDLSPQP